MLVGKLCTEIVIAKYAIKLTFFLFQNRFLCNNVEIPQGIVTFPLQKQTYFIHSFLTLHMTTGGERVANPHWCFTNMSHTQCDQSVLITCSPSVTEFSFKLTDTTYICR